MIAAVGRYYKEIKPEIPAKTRTGKSSFWWSESGSLAGQGWFSSVNVTCLSSYIYIYIYDILFLLKNIRLKIIHYIIAYAKKKIHASFAG